jgi:4'-phosphopantetheinyl transferase
VNDPSEVHVCYVFSDAVRDAAVLDRYTAMLSPDERDRRARFVFERDRHQFLVTRGIARTLLGRQLGLPPDRCAFVANAYGRPALAGSDPPAIDFNISHTTGLIAIAITGTPEIGLDVENIDRRPVDGDLPRRFFSPAEADSLESLAEPARTSRFFDVWTLKEAYIKARGMGLSLPLDQFTIHLDGEAPRITFATGIGDDPASWQFAQFDPSPRHRMAVAVRRTGADRAIRFRELVPAEL